MQHARFSPSAAHRWLRCPGSLALCETVPPRTSTYADEGTAAHDVANRIVLEDWGGNEAFAELRGTTVRVGDTDWPVTDAMIHGGLAFRDLVLEAMGEDGRAFADQRVEFSPFIGAPDAFGTADAIVVAEGRLTLIDYKYGAGVLVNAEANEQLMLYALGAMHSFDFLGPFEQFDLIIHQPRAQNDNPVSRWSLSYDDLMAFADSTKAVVQGILSGDQTYNPGEKQCRFCDARFVCPALKDEVLDTITGATAEDFDDVDEAFVGTLANVDPEWLAGAMAKVGLIEDWCKAVRGEIERRLFAGADVPGYKLVEGRMGNRKWSNPDEVAKLLKSWRFKNSEMYEYDLISPTTAEKLLKHSPARLQRINALVTRSPGKPSVAPATDKKPALSLGATAADFD